VQYRIDAMACGFCVATIGKAIGRMPGVKSVHVNLAHEEEQAESARKRDDVPERGHAGSISAPVRPAEGVRIEQSRPDFSWPDLHPTLNDRITLTLRVMLPRILARRFFNARSMSSFVRRD
jgi:copper chaperone CopZ